jgi:hypothetical protein
MDCPCTGSFRLHRGRRSTYLLHKNVRDAVRCHFDEGQEPRIIRLHFFVREEVPALRNSPVISRGALARLLKSFGYEVVRQTQ